MEILTLREETATMAEVDIMPVIGAVICQELGLEVDEVEVDTDLRESGLNSLSALMITVRLVEEHGIDLGPGTLKENYSLHLLQNALNRKEKSAGSPKTRRVRFETPPAVVIEAPTATATIEAPPVTVPDSRNIVSEVMKLIAKEMEIDESEFADAVEWVNFGLDSIMSLVICGRLREELDMEIESTIFADYETVGAFKKYVSGI